MKQLNTLLLIPLLSIALLSNAQSTYYVNSATGSDSNPGTSGLPFKTFHQAYTTAAAGDTLDLTGTFDWTDVDETGDASVTGYTIDKDINIRGQGRNSTYIQAASSYNTADRKVFYITGSTTDVTIENLTIRYGRASISSSLDGGGGINAYWINSFNLVSCNIEYNYLYAASTAAYGGGLYLRLNTGQTYNIDKCNINNNTVETDLGSATTAAGGGIYAFGAGTLNIDYSSIYDNHSDNSTPSHGWSAGTNFSSSITVTMTNSTVANNTQTGYVGTIRVLNVTSFTMTNCTVAGNQTCTTHTGSSADLNGGLWSANSTVNLKNNMFANNTYESGTARDVTMYSTGNTVNDNGYNVIEFSNYSFTGTGNITGDQSNLFGTGISSTPTLADNGTNFGTQTLAVSSGSVTIGAGGSGTNGTVSVPAMDQRGGTRVTMDIGSYGFDATMPVELIRFHANEHERNTVLLEWTTASEIDNSHFEIQRSKNGEDWTTLGRVEGNGTTYEKIDYTFEDRNPLELNYYRLKQVDFNGAFNYSHIRVIELGKLAKIDIFPNPVSGVLNVDIQGDLNVESFEVFDVSGRLLLHQKDFEPGTSFLRVDVSELERGFYFISLKYGIHSAIYKIIKE